MNQIESGDPLAAEKLLPLVYDELRRLAAARLSQEKPGQTLQATALVHDAYVRLLDVEKSQHWNSRGHFFGAASEAMRRLLVDQARRKKAAKRGGLAHRVALEDVAVSDAYQDEKLLDIDNALTRLAAEDPQAAARGSTAWTNSELSQLDALVVQLESAEKPLEEIAKKDPRIIRLMTIPGVGRKTAEVVVAALCGFTASLCPGLPLFKPVGLIASRGNRICLSGV